MGSKHGRNTIFEGTRKKDVDVYATDFTWEASLATNQVPTGFKINCSEDCVLWCVFFDDYKEGNLTASPYNFSYGDNPALLFSIENNGGNTLTGAVQGELVAVI